MTTTVTINGVTYNIDDKSPGSGLSESDIVGILTNLHSTAAYKNEISNDLANSGGQDSVVDITIDEAGYGTQTVLTSDPNDPNDPNRHSVNINSDEFTDSSQSTYAEKDTGNHIQKDVDTALAHEIAHLHQERVGEDDNGNGNPDPHDGENGNPEMGENISEEEQYAREKTNKIREELGLPPREDFAGEGDDITDMDGDGDIDEDDAALDAADLDSDGDIDQDDIDIQNAASARVPETGAAQHDPNNVGDLNGDGNVDGTDKVVAENIKEWHRVNERHRNIDVTDHDSDSGSGPNILPDSVYDPNDPNYGNPPSTIISHEAGSAGSLAELLVYYYNKFLGFLVEDQNTASPLVLDLNNNGIELISLENSQVMWDIDEDLFLENSGWTAGSDGFLAIDLNSDGIITDHTELFGDANVDGFSVLSGYDTNSDGSITSADTQFGDLLVWQDINENGVSDAGEVNDLAHWDITSIDLNASMPSNLYNEGHQITHTSTFTVDDGVNGPQSREIVDVWFEFDNSLSVYTGDYTLDVAAAFTATLRGYGDLPTLHISASLDNDSNDPNNLLHLLAEFSLTAMEDLFVDALVVKSDVENILFRWAGVDDLDPASRGPSVDARKLEFLEKFSGDDYLQFSSNSNPGNWAGQGLHRTFDFVVDAITARLMAQLDASKLFNSETEYNFYTDNYDGFTTIDQTILTDLLNISLDATLVQNKTDYWVNIVKFFEYTIGTSELSQTEYDALQNTIQASDSTLSIDVLLLKIEQNYEDQLSWTPDGDYILGTSAIDTYDGTVGDDFYSGAAGEDILNGGLGNDQLRGDADNDTLDGQLGDDILWGGHGDDTYKFFLGHGDDYIKDTSGNDTILFGAGITANDLSFIRVGYYDLVIQIDPNVGYGSIHIENQMSAALIETLEFDDASTLDMTILDHTYIGTEGNDTIYGVRTGFGGSGVDTIYGNGGDDVIYGYGPTGGGSSAVQNTIYGGDGNDTLFAENGGDYLNGEAGDDDIRGHVGNDTIIGGLGNDVLDGSRGDDIYHFNYGDGNDVIEEDRGTDKIVFGSGITAAMLDITRLDNNDVLIDIDGGLGGSIEINWQTYGIYTILETLEFSDASTIDMAALDLTLNGTSAGETLYGVRFGGSGIDTIYGHEGNDVIYGYRQVADYDNNFLYAGDGDDTVYAAHGDDYVEGNDGNDNIYGYNGVDTIYGGSGNDTLRGGNHDDVLYGEDGNDILLGENNDDTLIGGLGIDTLTGGGGYDTFTFLAASSFDNVDTITDFNTTYDAIDISDVLSGYDPLTDAITDFVQITDDGTDSTLFVDADGGADNFVAIALIDNKVGLMDEAALETAGNLITV